MIRCAGSRREGPLSIKTGLRQDRAPRGAWQPDHALTNLTGASQAGRALSVATGGGTEALAAADRGGLQVFRGEIPKALVSRTSVQPSQLANLFARINNDSWHFQAGGRDYPCSG